VGHLVFSGAVPHGINELCKRQMFATSSFTAMVVPEHSKHVVEEEDVSPSSTLALCQDLA
jgi:hypothetical protein